MLLALHWALATAQIIKPLRKSFKGLEQDQDVKKFFLAKQLRLELQR